MFACNRLRFSYLRPPNIVGTLSRLPFKVSTSVHARESDLICSASGRSWQLLNWPKLRVKDGVLSVVGGIEWILTGKGT